jgi:hypothetical protein
MSEVFYALSVFYALAGIALAGCLLWAGVEAVYFIYCKVRGIKY